MIESKLTKLLEAVSTPAAQVVNDAIEKVGKASVVAGPTAMVAEKVAEQPIPLTEYAAMVSIVGGLVWIAKMFFDSFIGWLKYKRGDKS